MNTISTYHTLCGIGNGRCNSTGYLKGVGGKLIVNVEAKTRHDKIELKTRIRL
jgi:hypothetical protein